MERISCRRITGFHEMIYEKLLSARSPSFAKHQINLASQLGDFCARLDDFLDIDFDLADRSRVSLPKIILLENGWDDSKATPFLALSKSVRETVYEKGRIVIEKQLKKILSELSKFDKFSSEERSEGIWARYFQAMISIKEQNYML